jgi:uridine kinase
VTSGSFADLAARVRATPPRLGGVRLVAIDGPSGAGKTRFAAELAKHLGPPAPADSSSAGSGSAAPVVHTDDLLDGWADQFTFWPRLQEQVLTPLSRGETATYLRYQWDRATFGGAPVTIPPADCVLLEGVSSARQAIRTRLSLSVFVTAPAGLRWKRAIARDGGDDVAFRAYLGRWRAAEDRHFARDRTEAFVDLVVDGSAEGRDDRYEQLRRDQATISCVSSGNGDGR